MSKKIVKKILIKKVAWDNFLGSPCFHRRKLQTEAGKASGFYSIFGYIVLKFQ